MIMVVFVKQCGGAGMDVELQSDSFLVQACITT